MHKDSPAMEDHQLPLLANPRPPRRSRLSYRKIVCSAFCSLLLSLLLSLMFAEIILLTPSFTARFVLKPPVANITRISSFSYNSTQFNPDGTKKPTDLELYRLKARLSLPNLDRDNLVPNTRHDYSARGCLYYKNECIPSVYTRTMFSDTEKLEMFARFELDEEVLGGVEESSVLPFDLWLEGAYTVSKHGSNWFGKIRVLRVECKNLKAAYPKDSGDLSGGLKQCKVQTWPVMTCTWCEMYRHWLLSFFKVRKGCPDPVM